MALLWYEGFDYFPNGDATASPLAGQMSSLGYVAVGGPEQSITVAPTAARFSGKGIELSATIYFGYTASFNVTLPESSASGFIGFALNLSAPAFTAKLMDVATDTVQCSVQFEGNGNINAYDGAGNLLGSSAVNSYAASVWNYIEIAATIASAAAGGALTVRVNTIPRLTLASVNTQQTANALFGGVFFNLINTCTALLDDMYFCDATGAAPYNTYLGNVRVQFLPPAGVGASTQFSASNTAEPNWQNASNVNVDDTQYVYSLTQGAEDDYTVAPMASTPVVFGARVKLAARQDNATQRQLEPCLISAGTEVRETAVALPQSYAWIAGAIHLTDPHTGAAWTYQAVNAAEVGFNLSV